MKRYVRLLEVSEGKGKESVSRFQQESYYTEITLLHEPKVITTLDSALSYISFHRNNELIFALIENTSVKSLLK